MKLEKGKRRGGRAKGKGEEEMEEREKDGGG